MAESARDYPPYDRRSLKGRLPNAIEWTALALFGISVLILVSLLLDPPREMEESGGFFLSRLPFSFLGAGTYILVSLVGFWSAIIFFKNRIQNLALKAFGITLMAVSFSTFLSLVMSHPVAEAYYGGYAGFAVKSGLQGLSLILSVPLVTLVFIISTIFATDWFFYEIIRGDPRGTTNLSGAMTRILPGVTPSEETALVEDPYQVGPEPGEGYYQDGDEEGYEEKERVEGGSPAGKATISEAPPSRGPRIMRRIYPKLENVQPVATLEEAEEEDDINADINEDIEEAHDEEYVEEHEEAEEPAEETAAAALYEEVDEEVDEETEDEVEEEAEEEAEEEVDEEAEDEVEEEADEEIEDEVEAEEDTEEDIEEEEEEEEEEEVVGFRLYFPEADEEDEEEEETTQEDEERGTRIAAFLEEEEEEEEEEDVEDVEEDEYEDDEEYEDEDQEPESETAFEEDEEELEEESPAPVPLETEIVTEEEEEEYEVIATEDPEDEILTVDLDEEEEAEAAVGKMLHADTVLGAGLSPTAPLATESNADPFADAPVRGDLFEDAPAPGKPRRKSRRTAAEVDLAMDQLMPTLTRMKDKISDLEESDAASSKARDRIYQQAVDTIFTSRKASVGVLQKKLNLGIREANSLIQRMETEGVIGPQKGKRKTRDILISRREFDEIG